MDTIVTRLRKPNSHYAVARPSEHGNAPVVRGWFRYSWQARLFCRRLRRQPGADLRQPWQVHKAESIDKAWCRLLDDVDIEMERGR